VTESQPAAVAPAAVAPAASNTKLPAPKDTKSSSSQAASDIETSLSSLAAQLGGAVAASENLHTDFLSAFVQLLQTQAAVCPPVTAFFTGVKFLLNCEVMNYGIFVSHAKCWDFFALSAF